MPPSVTKFGWGPRGSAPFDDFSACTKALGAAGAGAGDGPDAPFFKRLIKSSSKALHSGALHLHLGIKFPTASGEYAPLSSKWLTKSLQRDFKAPPVDHGGGMEAGARTAPHRQGLSRLALVQEQVQVQVPAVAMTHAPALE
eukprot:CAMPEP_0169118666 /NCGR_PEP_ID=MMETSP1015-20121227/31122_1 /TAXON_ID=342587 /ORGANISM="Karlodinium micrum, Strain CCMP2283" /LENGTH=141 /DNA_ID=CAMNT_0009181449 /DNA_START=218 /DNA_END=644 /DNA_ORIENTATION=-